MRSVFLSLLVALFAALAMAAAPQRSVIISWPNDTPDEIVEKSKDAIRKAKGEHSNHPFFGFFCLAFFSSLSPPGMHAFWK